MAENILGFEPSCQGQLVSLGNVKGRPGVGLVCRRNDSAVDISGGRAVLFQNPSRMWAMIQNTSANVIYISLESGSGTGLVFELLEDGIFQIDRNLPWTGIVYCDATSGTVNFMEASVQP